MFEKTDDTQEVTVPDTPDSVTTQDTTASTVIETEEVQARQILQPEVLPDSASSTPTSGNSSTGLVPAERNRMRTYLEEQHRRTVVAHDRIMAASSSRADMMEDIATKLEDQNTELSNYHKRLGI